MREPLISNPNDLTFTPAWRLSELVRRHAVSPVEITEHFLRRSEALNPHLNAYLTICADQAMAAAQAAENASNEGRDLGPLHGVPIAIKDLNPTKGIRTTRGSLVYKDWIPDEDDPVVERVRRAGAIIIGKTNTPEFGARGTTENRLGPACRNPWDTTRTAGGSSGGAAAALAAGLCPLATGSDAGGSIRIPGSFCGVYGIRPTQGRVPRLYKVPGGWGALSQNGPMSHSVRDAALLLQVIAGPDPRDPTSLHEPPPDFQAAAASADVKGLHIVWSPDLGYAITRQSSRAFWRAISNCLHPTFVSDWNRRHD
jgi:Asp-tRNA(Asn)/Glu-tRNA(Gln) amidotransferase A subunit family amidase